MSDQARQAFDDKWSKENYGQWFGYYPALPYHYCYPDLLHEYLNQFNGALEEAFQSHLELEQYKDQPAIKQKAIDVTTPSSSTRAFGVGWQGASSTGSCSSPLAATTEDGS
jgi:hypothetical protein